MDKISPDPIDRHPLLRRVRSLIIENHLFTSKESIIAGVSGGPDSMALVHLLSRINLHSGIFAVYVDHGLRPGETGAEIRTVENLCNTLKIPFSVFPVNVNEERQKNGTSVEEAARNLRYRALESERIRRGADVIAVAHTADDQAEEVLLRLIRGSGREGLAGMALKRNIVIRPLLGETKEDLVNYLRQYDVSYCQDSSNLSRAFLRNRVRLDLLPFLEADFNSAIRTNLLQTAEILRVEENLLRQIGQDTYDDLVRVDPNSRQGSEPSPVTIRLDIHRFLSVHPALQRRVLEKVFWKMGTPPGFRQIDQVRLMVTEGKTGSESHLGRGLRVWKTGEEVIFSHPGGRKPYRGSGVDEIGISLKVEGPGTYHVAAHCLTVRLIAKKPSDPAAPGELLLDADMVLFPLLLRTPHSGERFRPLGATGQKKVSRFLSDNKIPRWTRGDFPVLVSGDKIVAVVGLRIDHTCRIRQQTRNFLVICWQPITSSCA